jgi:hypothetical protein
MSGSTATAKPSAPKARWGRLDASPKRSRTSKLGRLTSINENPPTFLQPLAVSFEKVTKIEKIKDPKTGKTKIANKRTEYRLNESGERIPKAPKQWAFGAWDIESHCYDHTCSEAHRRRHAEGGHQATCRECETCAPCNPEHGNHWIAAQLSVLRIPDPYIEYVAQLEPHQLFGGEVRENGRYVEFLNKGLSLDAEERARCLAPEGCIDSTLRFLMAHPCFTQRAKASKGYLARGVHTAECDGKKNLKANGKPCRGCVRKPYAPGFHTNKCRYDRKFTKKDGTPCEGCSTMSTAWYSHFGGGYDINFALRWLSSHSQDADVVKQTVESVVDPERRAELKAAMEKRYEYKAESLLSGATHIQVKLTRLREVPGTGEPDSAAPEKQIHDEDHWVRRFLGAGLLPSDEFAAIKEAQEHLTVLTGTKLEPTGEFDKKTSSALKSFQERCGLPPTGLIDRQTSAALRYLRSQTRWEAVPGEIILLRDSFRLVASSLADAAKDFELKHPVTGETLTKIDDIDVKNPPPPDDPDFRRYCRIDTEVCVQLVTKFSSLIEQLGGTLEVTASSCAVSLFRRRYLRDKIPRHRHLTGCRLLCAQCGLETCSQECGAPNAPAGENMKKHQHLIDRHRKKMHRLCPTYPVGCFHFAALGKNGHRHGGHVEVLRQRLEAGRCYDVNSLYPFAMLGPVPVGPMQRYVNLTPREAKHEKPKSALRQAAGAWRLQKERTTHLAEKDPRWRDLVDKHGLEFAALEATFQVGSDKGPDLATGKPFDDWKFNRLESFKRIRRCGYVECVVSIPRDDSVPESFFPPLPTVRDSQNGEILFWPTGVLYGWWCYEELRALLEVPGARLHAVRQSVWFRGEPIFREFIETLYGERQRSDGAKKQLLKIVMNSTYGKTLQNPLKRRVLRLQAAEERPKGWLPTNPNPPNGDDFTWPWGSIQEYREAPFFLPHWGSLITARARMVIWRVCVDVERGKYGKDKYVSYLDTDSAYTTAKLDDICDEKKLGMLKLEYALPDDKRKKYLAGVEAAWEKYQREHAARVESTMSDVSLTDEEKAERVRRLEARKKYYKAEHYEADRDETKYKRARPDGIISCNFWGPKLYEVLDPETGDEVKTVHKGTPEPNAEKLRKFIRGEALTGKPRAPKAGTEIRNDFVFDPITLTRTGQTILWKKPKRGEPEIAHKRVHHHDPAGRGMTSPRHVEAHDEFELEESFRSRRKTSAARLYEEWTGKPWIDEEQLAQATAETEAEAS